MPTVFMQILTAYQAKAYATNSVEAGINPQKVSGFCIPYSDGQDLSPQELIEIFEAEHPTVNGSPQTYDAHETYLLVFENSPSVHMNCIDALSELMHGDIAEGRFQPPYRGNGFSGAGRRFATQYLIDGSVLLPPGSQIRKVAPSGAHEVVAQFIPNEDGTLHWSNPGAPWTSIPHRTEGDHDLFIALGGYYFPVYELSRKAVGIVMPDTRAAWLTCPAYDELERIPDGSMAVYAIEHVDQLNFIRTVAQWRGKNLIVEEIDNTSRTLKVVYVGAPDADLVEWGFEGDQFHGFRATLPQSEVPENLIGLQILEIFPGQRPRQAMPEGPFDPQENKPYHDAFLLQEDRTPLPAWKITLHDGQRIWAVAVPDRRATQLMTPGVRSMWHKEDGGFYVPASEAFPGAFIGSATTVVVTDDNVPFIVEGVANGVYRGFRMLPDHVQEFTEAIDPARVVRRDERMLGTEENV